jgi:alkylation response protein AidB-like acyl-CoA dehydrogenase
MAQAIADRRDIEFVLYEQMNVEALTKTKKFSEFNRKLFDMMITEGRNLAIKEILPTYGDGDKGCIYENGQVRVPESFHRIFKLVTEGEWIALTDDPEVGGQGVPMMITQAVWEYFSGANTAFAMYPMVTHGAGKLVEVFGDDKLKKRFLPKLYRGEWAGTMALTEPGAGSDVGALTTTARENPDGTYTISGEKIFISGAEQNLTENIIHPVIARIEGSPPGPAGITLFLVPKIWVNDDGSLGESNDVLVTGIEEKMGLHGSATCQVTFGAKGKCRGFLLGEKERGLKAMFHMMNEERLNVGTQSLSMASTAYLHALNYARERVQGKHLTRMLESDAPAVPIIQHPDVRRMLLWMKAQIEGLRSLNYYIGNMFDRLNAATTPEDKTACKEVIELLTPIIKAYSSDRAFEVIVQAMQIYGGYGYCKDYPIEQLLRDCKITSLYEGANGIQAMDLMGRKLGRKQGAVFMNLLGEIQKTVGAAKPVSGLSGLAETVEQAANRLAELAMYMGQTAMSSRLLDAFAFAAPFLEAMGDVIMGWMHLWRLTIVRPRVEKLLGGLEPEARGEKIAKDKEAAFYDGLMHSGSYYIETILPVTMGKMAAIQKTSPAIMEINDKSFGS